MANKRLSAVITIGGAVAGSLRGAFGAIRSETTSLGSSIQRLKDRQRELNAELEKVGRNGSATAGLRVQYARQELDLIGKQISALRQRQALERSRASNRAERQEIQGKIGSTLATGAMVMAPVGAAINEAANFDYQLQLIGNTADMTSDQVGALKRSILDTSKATSQSATNIQKGMGFLVAAGMDPQKATRFLGAIGKTATASAADVEDLAKMVFTLEDSLKIGADGMQAAIDSMAQAGKEGNVELRDMAKQLPVLGSGFVSLKMEGREAAATMGAALQIARKGAADADEAANNMKNFIAKIMSPETLKKAKKEFNLDLYKVIKDAQTKGQNPFEAAMGAIIKATKGDQKAIGELFQDMQVQNFLRPMIQNWEEYKRIKDKALSADGVIERDFAKMMATTKQQIVEVGNALGRLGVALGSVFSGDTAGKSAGMAERIGQLAEFIEQNRELVRVTGMVVGGLFAARLAVLGLGWAWTTASGIWMAGRAMWLAAPAVITAMGSAASLTAAKFTAMSGALAGLTARFLAVLAVANVGDAIAGKFGVGQEPVDKEQDEKNWKRATTWEKVQSSLPRGIEHVGRLLGMENITNQAQAERIKSETEYLRKKDERNVKDLPKPAAGNSTTVEDNSQHTYNITQQPGQDAKALAEEIERLRKKAAGVNARSSLLDGVGAQ